MMGLTDLFSDLYAATFSLPEASAESPPEDHKDDQPNDGEKDEGDDDNGTDDDDEEGCEGGGEEADEEDEEEEEEEEPEDPKPKLEEGTLAWSELVHDIDAEHCWDRMRPFEAMHTRKASFRRVRRARDGACGQRGEAQGGLRRGV